VANNNYPQITTITSEALQAQIRNLLPSQQGFGTDLMAQNVIVPVIDLTAAAEGSALPVSMQQAWDFSSTITRANNSSSVAVNNAGFWILLINWSMRAGSGTENTAQVTLSDGLSTKVIWEVKFDQISGSLEPDGETTGFIVYLRAGDSLSIVSNQPEVFINCVSRQIADVNGNLVNPLGYTPQ